MGFDVYGLSPKMNKDIKICYECKRIMPEDECGDEFPEERVCDQCAGIEE